jgi:hypothetical protein
MPPPWIPLATHLQELPDVVNALWSDSDRFVTGAVGLRRSIVGALARVKKQ